MTSIPVAICKILINKFETHDLGNKKRFVDFSLHFRNIHAMQNILQKKDEYPSLIISEISEPERGGYLNV